MKIPRLRAVRAIRTMVRLRLGDGGQAGEVRRAQEVALSNKNFQRNFPVIA